MGSLLWRIAWTESLRWSKRRSTYVVGAGLMALTWLSAAVGAGDLEARRQAHASQLQAIAADQVKPRLPMTGTTVERVLRLTRAPEVGSIIARGDDVRLPAYFDFGPAGLVWGRSVITDTVQAQTGALLDVESILRVLGGLIAVLLATQTIGGSRFRGQLSAWQALGVPPVVGVAGKLLGCMVLLAAGTISALVVAAGAASWHLGEGVPLGMFAWTVVLITLFLSTQAAIGTAVALWMGTPTRASIAGVAAWALVSMVGPQISESAARLLAPIEPRDSFEALRDQTFSEDVRAAEQALGDLVLDPLAPWKGHPPPLILDSVVEAHSTQMEKIWTDHVRAGRKTAQAADATWYQASHRQLAISRWLQLVTPGACLIRAVTAFTGTGAGLSVSWYEHAEARQQQLNAALFDNRSQATVRVLSQTTVHRRHPTLRWSATSANLRMCCATR